MQSGTSFGTLEEPESRLISLLELAGLPGKERNTSGWTKRLERFAKILPILKVTGLINNLSAEA